MLLRMMNPLLGSNGSNGSFLQNLEWRRAVKHFGSDPVDTTLILKAMVNAPSSFGLQPYRILCIRNKDLKKKLRVASYDQPQVTECHTLFVLCARTDIEARFDEYIKETNAKISRAAFLEYLEEIPDRLSWAKCQTHLALGFGLAACAEQQIASCPMDGFHVSEVRNILGLPDHIVPCVYLSVGSSTPQDCRWSRYRFAISSLVEERN